VAVVSLLTASALAPWWRRWGPRGGAEYVALAILLALLVGLVQLTLGLFRLGVVVNFLSHPVIVGFTNAAALIIGLSQLNKIFGVSMPRSEHFINDIWAVLQQMGDTHLLTLVMGVAAFAIMWGLKKYQPKLPGVLIAVVVTTLASWALGFAEHGGKVVGRSPPACPPSPCPQMDLGMAMDLLPSAIIISLVGFMEAISIAKAMAAKTKDRIDPNQELIGQGLANIAGSLTQAYPTSGSFSRSAVNLNAGARTGMSSVFTGPGGADHPAVPDPAALPPAPGGAGGGDHDGGDRAHQLQGHPHAWEAHKHDGVAAIVTFIATLAFAPHLDNGILVGAGLAIVLFLYRTMKPRVALLGRFRTAPCAIIGCTRRSRPMSASSPCASTASSISPTSPISRTPSWRRWRIIPTPSTSWWWRRHQPARRLGPGGPPPPGRAPGGQRHHRGLERLKRQVIQVLDRTHLMARLGGRTSSPPRRWPWTPSTIG
jgi:sulfate permease, SulP family